MTADAQAPFCQSCGMPLDEGHSDLIAKLSDGSDAKYCTYCWTDGQFTQPDITMAEMVEVGVPHLTPTMGEAVARAHLTARLSSLKRWSVIT